MFEMFIFRHVYIAWIEFYQIELRCLVSNTVVLNPMVPIPAMVSYAIRLTREYPRSSKTPIHWCDLVRYGVIGRN